MPDCSREHHESSLHINYRSGETIIIKVLLPLFPACRRSRIIELSTKGRGFFLGGGGVLTRLCYRHLLALKQDFYTAVFPSPGLSPSEFL